MAQNIHWANLLCQNGSSPQTSRTCRAHAQAELPGSLDPIAQLPSARTAVYRTRRPFARCFSELRNDDGCQRKRLVSGSSRCREARSSGGQCTDFRWRGAEPKS